MKESMNDKSVGKGKLFDLDKYRAKDGRASSKSNTAKLFRRYVWLVDLISRAGRITFEEINRKWRYSPLNEDEEDLPLKTFHNHKEAIQEMFGITIACARSGGYTYYIENAEDLNAEGAKRWLLNSFAVSNLITESKSLNNRILFEEIPSGQQFLTPLIEAMRDSVTVQLTHKSFDRETSHTFEVEPYCVKVFRQRWYLAAYNKEYDGMRVYALDRILDVNITATHFDMPKDFDPEGYFANSFGIIVKEGEEAEKIVLKVCGKEINYLRTLPLHHSQVELKRHELEGILPNDADNGLNRVPENPQEDYVYFEYHLYPTIDFQQELLAQCVKNEIEVLEPEWLREEIRSIAAGIVASHTE